MQAVFFVGLSKHQSILLYVRSTFLRNLDTLVIIVSPNFCRNINTLVETSVSQVLLSIELLIHLSGPVQRQYYCLWDYGYIIKRSCAISPILCRTVDTLFKISASLVLLFVGGRCQAIGSEMKELLIFGTLHALHHHVEPLTVLGVGTGNLFNLKKFHVS